MKYVLLVEGRTESKAVAPFLKRWLDRRLKTPVGIKIAKAAGWAKMKKDAPDRAANYLSQNDVIAVVGLLDLYGPDYPPGKTAIADRYEWLKSEIERTVHRRVAGDRFAQFLAVHEFEAWLLADPPTLPEAIRCRLPRHESPERINFDKPPKKLLRELYRSCLNREYREIGDGAQLFGKLDVETAYRKCPYLRQLLDWMLTAAQRAGIEIVPTT